MMTGFGMGFGGVGVIGMILFWIAVIAEIVWLNGRLKRTTLDADARWNKCPRDI